MSEIPEEVRADLEFLPVETMDQVLDYALERPGPKGEKPETKSGADAGRDDDKNATYAH